MDDTNTGNEVIIPQSISRLALYSTPFIFNCMVVCYIHEYGVLLFFLWCLFGSSVMYWNNMKNRFVYNIDRILAVSVLGITSNIANTDFSQLGKTIWYSGLLTTGIAYFVSLYIFENKKESSLYQTNIQYMNWSVYYHMFFVHFLPTTTFVICVVYYRDNPKNAYLL